MILFMALYKYSERDPPPFERYWKRRRTASATATATASATATATATATASETYNFEALAGQASIFIAFQLNPY